MPHSKRYTFFSYITAFVLATLCTAAYAEGQQKLTNSKTAIRQHFWKELYLTGGNTIFCNEAFKRKSATLTADHIYQKGWIESFVKCSNSIECKRNPKYQQLASDLHNLFPANKRVQLSKRDSSYELVLGQAHEKISSSCDYKKLNQYFEPGNRVKGDVARAVLYMHLAYDAPIIGSPNMYVKWHKLDPPDEHEKKRNNIIEKIQGNRNPLIDDPSIAEKLIVRGR